MAQAEGIAPEAKKEAGLKAIALARKALEINTQMCGIESTEVAHDIFELASALDCFNNVDDDEVLRLYEQSKAIYSRVHGSSSLNVGVNEKNIGDVYYARALSARAAYDVDRLGTENLQLVHSSIENMRLALPRYREAVRIYRAVNRMDKAENALRLVSQTEDLLQKAERLYALEVACLEAVKVAEESAATNV